jgi:hypothetical protein
MAIISCRVGARTRASRRPENLSRAQEIAGARPIVRASRRRGLPPVKLPGLACVLACVLALVGLQAPGAPAQTAGPVAQAEATNASATLGQCVTSVLPGERSATFSGEMTAISGSARMSMRIDIQERLPGAARFRTVSAPGLGVWRVSEPGVKTYRYVKQVTNLSAPAFYRALVGFRWITAKGRLIRHVERGTTVCGQPQAPPSAAPGAGVTSGSPSPAGA